MQTDKRDNQKAFLVKKTAARHGVTKDYVYKVIDGRRTDVPILTDYISMKEIADRIEYLQDNPLMAAVLETVPF